LKSKLILSVLISFLINIIISPFIIKFLRKIKFGQPIRDDGPKSHLAKANTPTMGGAIFLISIILTSMFFLKNNPEGILVLIMTVGFGLIGFCDDFIKIFNKRSLGLRASQKIIMQIFVILIFFWYINNFLPMRNYNLLYIPFVSHKFFDLGAFFNLFIYFIMLGTVNSINLTDGLDGLATGVTVLVVIFFMYAGLHFNNSMCLVSGAVVGSLMGFLLFNSHPAKIFMGDSGSFALGGFVASVSILLRMPLFLILVGVIYILESLSVIIQVCYFKLTHGKRIFKMSPFHHHLELSGMKETKVVALFYFITALACLIALKAFNLSVK